MEGRSSLCLVCAADTTRASGCCTASLLCLCFSTRTRSRFAVRTLSRKPGGQVSLAAAVGTTVRPSGCWWEGTVSHPAICGVKCCQPAPSAGLELGPHPAGCQPCRGVLRWNVPDGKYAEVAAAKALLLKIKAFQGLTPETLQQQLPIYAISLTRATNRRTAMARTMAAAGVSGYRLVDAADSHNAPSITPAELRRSADRVEEAGAWQCRLCCLTACACLRQC